MPDDPTAPVEAPDPIVGVLGAPPPAPHVLGNPRYQPGYGVPASRLLRAPGAEHPLPQPIPRGVNPNRMQRLTQDEVDTVVDAASARSLGDVLERHRPEQAPPGMPSSNERTR